MVHKLKQIMVFMQVMVNVKGDQLNVLASLSLAKKWQLLQDYVSDVSIQIPACPCNCGPISIIDSIKFQTDFRVSENRKPKG